jgi:hypothetical protein
MTDTVSSDIEKIRNPVSSGPVPENLSLHRRFGILGGRNMIDDSLDPGRIKYPVFPSCHKIANGEGRGDFVAEHRVEPQHHHILPQPIDKVGIHDFFYNGFSQWTKIPFYSGA